jgi:hypothetical protein
MLRHMRTSFDLPDGLLRRAKALARKRGVPLRELVLEGLTHLVRQGDGQGYVLPDRSFRGDGLVAGLDMTYWAEIRERIYEGRGG